MHIRSGLRTFAFHVGVALSVLGGVVALNGHAMAGPLPKLLYVVEPSVNAVKIYPATGGPSVGTIPVTPGSPIDIAADASGTVYISDFLANTVGIYPYRATSRSRLLRIANPQGVCVDLAGTVYVTDYNQEVSVFQPGRRAPTRRFENPLPSFAAGSGSCALDARGDLSVIFNFTVAGFEGNDMGRFPAGDVTSSGLGIFLRPGYFDDVAVDRAGNMLVNDLRHWIQVFPPLGGHAIGKVANSPGGLDQAFAFDRSRDHLFVNSTASPQEIKEYSYPGQSVVREISIDAPAGMFAVSPGPA